MLEYTPMECRPASCSFPSDALGSRARAPGKKKNEVQPQVAPLPFPETAATTRKGNKFGDFAPFALRLRFRHPRTISCITCLCRRQKCSLSREGTIKVTNLGNARVKFLGRLKVESQRTSRPTMACGTTVSDVRMAARWDSEFVGRGRSVTFLGKGNKIRDFDRRWRWIG